MYHQNKSKGNFKNIGELKTNESSKKISKEEFNVRAVGIELDSLLRFLVRADNGSMPVSKESKEQLKAVIKDYCDTISKYVDLF